MIVLGSGRVTTFVCVYGWACGDVCWCWPLTSSDDPVTRTPTHACAGARTHPYANALARNSFTDSQTHRHTPGGGGCVRFGSGGGGGAWSGRGAPPPRCGSGGGALRKTGITVRLVSFRNLSSRFVLLPLPSHFGFAGVLHFLTSTPGISQVRRVVFYPTAAGPAPNIASHCKNDIDVIPDVTVTPHPTPLPLPQRLQGAG